ncbi:hypothetical protein FOA52_010759 [Chlamydomonas sp. UWO 241]|nr:hypothetical protein FOA52_010759 [Chlamydomonas sp. UWO 241]
MADPDPNGAVAALLAAHAAAAAGERTGSMGVHGGSGAEASTSGSTHEADSALIRQLALSRGALAPSASRTELVRLLRMHNFSTPSLRGEAVQARVLRVAADRLYVDPGFFGLSEVPRSEVGVTQVHTPDGAPPEGRTSGDDIRVGDVISVKIDALYTPYGDMQVEVVPADTSRNQSPVWRELADSMARRRPVQGRVLNACAGGYAVGVAGIVALLPYGRFTMETARRVGTLQPFVVEGVDERRRLLVVADVKKGSDRSLRA